MIKRLVWLSLVGLVLEGLWIGVCSLGPLRQNSGPFLALVILAFLLCIGAFFRLPIKSGAEIGIVLLFAFLFRFTLLLAPPHQSEDVYRYLWDAKTAAMGISPYAYAPQAPELEQLRDSQIYPMINSKPYITAYPPLSQILFRFSYTLFGANVTAMKAVFSLLEFLTLLLAWRLLVLWKQSLQPLLLMAWHPFFVFEFSASGHSDSVMMFFALLSFYLLSRQKPLWGLVSYAGAVMGKLHPALWFPLYVRRWGWKPAMPSLLTGLGLVLLYFRDIGAWLHYLNSLKLYFRLFEFNASIHYFIRFIGRIAFNAAWDKEIGPYLAAILVAITIAIAWKFPLRDVRQLLHAGFWLMTADLCLATTAHPWYICWAAFALPLFPYAFMTYWTGACFLSYLAYAFHPVYEPAWVLMLEYIPMYALMAYEIRRGGPLMMVWFERRGFHGEEKAVPGTAAQG